MKKKAFSLNEPASREEAVSRYEDRQSPGLGNKLCIKCPSVSLQAGLKTNTLRLNTTSTIIALKDTQGNTMTGAVYLS